MIGCCGWVEARARYFQHFSSVELQDTFYQPPSVELARKWREQAPPGFRFTMKAWQLITHPASSPTYRRLKRPVPESRRAACGCFQPTAEVRAAWEQTMAVARAVEAEAIVFQCPASFRPEPRNLANLESFFGALEREGRWIAWEPRGAWPPDTIRQICRRHDLVHCVDPFQAEPVYGRAVYFRLHGRNGYRYQYSDQELERLAQMVEQFGSAGPRPIYVMFNNVFMKDDALRFMRLWGLRPSRQL